MERIKIKKVFIEPINIGLDEPFAISLSQLNLSGMQHVSIPAGIAKCADFTFGSLMDSVKTGKTVSRESIIAFF
jgi:hypothetical protein